MSFADETRRREPPLAGGEITHIMGSLDRMRATFAWKCADLDAAGLRATVGTSTMTLGGLLKHLAAVEDIKLRWEFLGRDPGEPWNKADWDADPDWPWNSAADDSPAELYELWAGAVARSRSLLVTMLADGDLDQLSVYVTEDGKSPSLRRILFDLLEEYSRHTGHADLIREAIDGRSGEDPPD